MQDYKENGKGFVLVDFDGPKPLVKRVKVDMPREFIKRSLDYNNLESGIAGIKETIKDFENKPILDLTINNVESDTSVVYEMITEELGDLALMIRPNFNKVGEESIDEIFINKDSLGPKELLIEQLKDYRSDEVNQLAVDLYDYLSKDKLEESKELINQFFDEFYDTSKDEPELESKEVEEEDEPQEESEDIQVTFKEVLE